VAEPMWSQEAYNDIPTGVKKGERVTVQQVQFAPLMDNATANMPQNIGLIMDVPLDVSVELGKTRKTIKEILELNQGSIIQLDKMAGEPVDLMVNGKLIAKGEVVVIDENYGIRITAIISPVDRVNKLQ
jgi:flagellar motor switch protein FliN/FliY